MNRYKKITSGCGTHGIKYEINILLYHLLKAYHSEENFQLSNGKTEYLKWDDVILETDTIRIFCQAKHVEKESKKIPRSQLFGDTGKYSLYVYLKVAYKQYFQKFLSDVQVELEELRCTIQEDIEDFEKMKSMKLLLCVPLSEQINSKETYDNLISNLLTLNNRKIKQLLRSFEDTSFQLVTNISPNEKLLQFCCSSLESKPLAYFDNTVEQYNFNTDNSTDELTKLIKKSKIPKWFVEIFLKKFFLIVISDKTLKENVKSLLLLLSSHLHSSDEITYADMYELTEMWQSNKVGIYLNRNEINHVFFAPIVSKKFIQELKTHENLIKFSIEPLLKILNDTHALIITVETPRYLLIMEAIYRKFDLNKIAQSLFVNPFSDAEIQKLLIKAFFHPKYTYLICVVHYNVQKSIIGDLISKIEYDGKLRNYKRMVLFCYKDIEIGHTKNRIVLYDNKWFRERKLNISRYPNSLGVMGCHYINREIIRSGVKYSEEEFLRKIIGYKSKFFIVADSPGMGKTMILFSLAAKINQGNQFWAVIIQLNRFTELLERHLESKTIPQLDEFLYLSMRTNYEKQISKIPNIIILLIDGFDEICPDYAVIVTEFLKNIRSMDNVKTTVITTRKHLKSHLENYLMEDAYAMVPFTDDEVCTVIREYRPQKADHSKNWKSEFSDDVSEFLSVPLHAKMFAELLENSNTDLCSNDTINLYEIYNAFLNKKKDIFIKEKCNCQGNIRNKKIHNEEFQNLMDIYTKIALELTFRKEILEIIGINKTISSTFSEELCANGILEFSETAVRFVHQTFTDFFVSKWAVEKIFEKTSPNIVILKIIFNEILIDFYVCKQFLESYLKQHWTEITNEILGIFGSLASNFNKPVDMLVDFHEYPYITRMIMEKCDNLELINKISWSIVETGKRKNSYSSCRREKHF